jgi:hypothetical protein
VRVSENKCFFFTSAMELGAAGLIIFLSHLLKIIASPSGADTFWRCCRVHNDLLVFRLLLIHECGLPVAIVGLHEPA